MSGGDRSGRRLHGEGDPVAPEPRSSRHRLLGAAAAALALALAVAWAEWPAPAAAPPLAWGADLYGALERAGEDGRPTLIRFDADWCAVCRKLDRRTLRDAAVVAELERFERVRVDLTAPGPREQTVQARYGIGPIPTLLVVDPTGEVREEATSVGFVTAATLLERLRRVP